MEEKILNTRKNGMAVLLLTLLGYVASIALFIYSITLYDEQTASFGEDDDYNQADSAGFINLFGLSIKERAKLSKNWPEIQ